MKRAFVVLLALVMGAGLLFAADQAPAKWGAWIEGDLILWNQDEQAGLTPSWSGTGQYTTLSLSYAEKDFGFSMTSEFGSTGWGTSLRNMSAWYSLLDGKVKFTAGKDRDASYRPTTQVEGAAAYSRIANAEWGLLTQVFPVKGLSVGAFVKFTEGLADQDYENMIGAGASYEIPNIAKVFVQYRTMDSLSSTWGYTLEDQIGAAVNVTAVKDIPLFVAFGMNMYASGDNVYTILFSTAYTLDKLSVALDVGAKDYTLEAFGGGADGWYIATEAKVSYKLNPTYTVGANLGWSNGWDYTTYGDVGFFAYPWVKVNVGSASSLDIGFSLSSGGYDILEDNPDVGEQPLRWYIPIKYVISF